MENNPKNPTSSSPATGASANKPVSPVTTPTNRPTTSSPTGSVERTDSYSSSNSNSTSSARPELRSSSISGESRSQDSTASDRSDVSRESWISQQDWRQTVNQLPQSIKDLGSKAADQFNKLSTTQKVVGGALLLGGLSYLASRAASGSRSEEREQDVWDATARRTRDFRSGSIPKVESSSRSEWEKRSSSPQAQSSRDNSRSAFRKGNEPISRSTSNDYDDDAL